jgi:hypothetical protein
LLLKELCDSSEAALWAKVPQTSALEAATMGKPKPSGWLTDKASVSKTLNLAVMIRENKQK